MLPLSISIIFYFPYGRPVAAYFLFLVLPTFFSSLLHFLRKTRFKRQVQSKMWTIWLTFFFVIYTGFSFLPVLWLITIFMHSYLSVFFFFVDLFLFFLAVKMYELTKLGMPLLSILDKYHVKFHIQPTKIPLKSYTFTELICSYDCHIMHPATKFKYSVIQKDGLNFVRLYFLNYTRYVNDLHNIWKRRS